MAIQSISYIEDLSKRDAEKITQLLMVNPSASISATWLADQGNLISSFSPRLTRPTSALARLAMHLPFTPAKAVLCASHKPLNPHLIRRIFLQISAECTTRLRYLKARCDTDPAMKNWIWRLQTVNSLWMSPAVYRVAFETQPDDPRHDRIDSGCEACILSRIGGDREILMNLRIGAMSRKRKRRPLPRLLALLDGWISWLGEGEEFLRETDEFAKKVRAVRRELQKERRQARRDKRNGVKPKASPSVAESQETDEVEEREEGDGANEEDFEEDIIDYYRSAFSTTNLLAPSPIPDHIHPAFHDSMIFNVPPLARRYSQSVYSRPSGFESSETVGARNCSSTSVGTHKAEKHARAYMHLVGISELPAEEVLARPRSSESGITRWSTVYNH